MVKLIHRHITVKYDSEGIPVYLYLPDNQSGIKEVIERWVDTGCWWEKESEKLFFRLYCENGSIVEIYQDLGNGTWFLYKIYD